MQLVRESPACTEDDIAWKITEEMSAKAAALLAPVFEKEMGRSGRLSIQTDPTFFRNARAIVDQRIVDTRHAKFEDFRRAYDAGGMKVKEFDAYGAPRRTFRHFCRVLDDVVLTIRDVVIPNPDI